MCCRCATFDGMKELGTAIRVKLSGSNGFWMIKSFKQENNIRDFMFGLRTVSLDIFGMPLLVRSHLCSSPYDRIFFRFISPHVGNLSIRAFHLYRNLHLETLA